MPDDDNSSIDIAIANLKRAILSEPKDFELQETGTNDWEEKWSRRIQDVRDLPQLLRRRRNATLGINRLPDELYGDIITRIQPELETYEQLPTAPPLKSDNGWISATHVCHRWRSAASSEFNKSLWRRIRIPWQSKQASKVATTFLERSSPLLVEVVHEHSMHTSPHQLSRFDAFYSLLRDAPNRLGALHLRGSFDESHPATQLLGKSSYRNLTSFGFYNQTDDRDEDEDADAFLQEFAGRCPKLQRLAISPHSFPKPWPGISLTHLYIFDTFIPTKMEKWLQFLSGFSRALQILYLSNTGCTRDVRSLRNFQAPDIQTHLPSLLRLEIHDDIEYEAIIPFLCLHNVVLPNQLTIVWQYTKLFEEQFYLDEFQGLPGLLPHSNRLSKLEKIIWISRNRECFTLENDTIFDDVKNICEALPLIFGSCPNVKSMAAPSYNWEDWILDYGFPLAQYPSLQSFHLCWNPSVFALLATLEAGVCASTTTDVELSLQDIFQRHRLLGTVFVEYREIECHTVLPNLQSLVIYIGNVGIDHTIAHQYVFSQVLKNMGLEQLQLTESHEMVRHRQKSGKTFKLAFRKGGEENFETL
ncbi:hypothetical protein CPB83DRAFT_851851 [Crepidotus variabilis]|uniref:F-box domain-containing protein n=1 Tax=Crepidotus variabilis TaxID=179855 RepID=A0A9P6JRI5_9AGAR|nr:hypothetical protein CPB83DRAFT_851851 [Crepidotus variabilis]